MSDFYFKVALVVGSLLVLLAHQLRAALKQRKPVRTEIRVRY
jgi:hypothetical protein